MLRVRGRLEPSPQLAVEALLLAEADDRTAYTLDAFGGELSLYPLRPIDHPTIFVVL